MKLLQRMHKRFTRRPVDIRLVKAGYGAEFRAGKAGQGVPEQVVKRLEYEVGRQAEARCQEQVGAGVQVQVIHRLVVVVPVVATSGVEGSSSAV